MRFASFGGTAALCAATLLAGSCGGSSSGAVIVVDSELCEFSDPGGAPEWAKIVITVGELSEGQRFCGVLQGEQEGCSTLAQGSFPLVLPIESASGMGIVPIQIELFATAEATTPTVCETSTLQLMPDEVVWAYTVLRRPCGTSGECVAGTLTNQTWTSLADVIADEDAQPIACGAPDPQPALPIQRITTGAEHACLIDAANSVFCWGSNDSRQLGVPGMGELRPALIDLGAGRTPIDITAGRRHTCALISNGEVECWGLNDQGQLGRGAVGDGEGTLQRLAVNGLTDAVQIASAQDADHTCARTSTGAVFCWGLNATGQIDGTPQADDPATTATSVSLPAAATWVAVGGRFGSGHHSCATLDDDTTSCWGHNLQNQLGTMDVANTMPVTVGGMTTGFTQVSAGGFDTCAVDASNALFCWGRNDTPGTLGFALDMGGQTAVPDPTPVDTSSTVLPPTAPTAGPPRPTVAGTDQAHCFLDAGGAPLCYGQDGMTGRLGGAPDTFTATPVTLGTMLELESPTFTQIAMGRSFACALPSGNDMPVCWGENARGQRGLGSTMEPTLPTEIPLCN